MADNETDVAPGANPPSAEAHYAASRQSATNEAPKVEVIPEAPVIDITQKADAEKPESEDDEKPEDADDEKKPDEGQKDNEDETHRPKRRSWKQENIRLTRINRELRERLAADPSGNQPPQQAVPRAEPAKEDAKRPKQEDFENYDAYLDARDDFNAKRIRSDVTKEFEQKETARRQSAEQAEAVTKFKESADKAKAKYADFEDAVWELGFQITPTIANLIAATDDPGELAYHLSQHPDEAKRIASLPLTKAAIELGKIEAKLGTAATPAPKAVSKPPSIPETKAPPPTKTVPQGSGKPARPLEQLSQNDFYARRQAALKG